MEEGRKDERQRKKKEEEKRIRRWKKVHATRRSSSHQIREAL